MALVWKRLAKTKPVSDPYLAFPEEYLGPRCEDTNGVHDGWRPLHLSLPDLSARDTAKLLGEIGGPTKDLVIETHERQLVTRSALSRARFVGDRLFGFVRLSDLPAVESRIAALRARFSDLAILAQGPLLPANWIPLTGRELQFAPRGRKGAVIGVIDDGINLFSDALLDPLDRSLPRVRAAWLQTARLSGGDSEASADRVLTDEQLRDARSRARAADWASAKLHLALPFLRKQTAANRSRRWPVGVNAPTPDFLAAMAYQTHGAHVADLAAGDGPWDVLAVDVPSMVVADTTGRLLDFFALRALRWLFRMAERIGKAEGTAMPPLVVVMSLGHLAGRKRSGAVDPLAEQLARMTAARNASAPTRMVLPFGNSRETRQSARLSLDAEGGPREVVWRVPPDDATPSYVEIRYPDFTVFDLTIVAPDGTSHTVEVRNFVSDDLVLVARGSSRPVARLYRVDEPGARHSEVMLALAVAPTVAHELDAPVAPAGAWRIRILPRKSFGTVSIEVQRDDAPVPVVAAGRQSYFDGRPHDPRQRLALGLPDPVDDAVLAGGTYSALATAASEDPCVYAVAAAQRTPYASGGIVPSPYAPKGDVGTAMPMPTISAIADEGPANPGVLGAGGEACNLFTMSGSSVAAPKVARALAELAAKKPGLATGVVDRAGELARLDLLAVPQQDHRSRIGEHVLAERRRRP